MRDLVKTTINTALQSGKCIYSIPRYLYQRMRGLTGYVKYAARYPISTLFIAGMPKSGTSWLESMLASLPGFSPVMPPSAIAYELRQQGSHHMDLTPGMLDHLHPGLHVLKLHVPGSRNNSYILSERNLNYIIQVRDLRDVAVSHVFYVRSRPWHPDYPMFADASIREGLGLFAERHLPDFVTWVGGWLNNRDEERSLIVRYEDLLQAPGPTLRNVVSHFGIGTSQAWINQTTREHSFSERSGGRTRGEEKRNSFRRKGVSGDWKNHFDDELLNRYLDEAGAVLERLDYTT